MLRVLSSVGSRRVPLPVILKSVEQVEAAANVPGDLLGVSLLTSVIVLQRELKWLSTMLTSVTAGNVGPQILIG